MVMFTVTFAILGCRCSMLMFTVTIPILSCWWSLLMWSFLCLSISVSPDVPLWIHWRSIILPLNLDHSLLQVCVKLFSNQHCSSCVMRLGLGWMTIQVLLHCCSQSQVASSTVYVVWNSGSARKKTWVYMKRVGEFLRCWVSACRLCNPQKVCTNIPPNPKWPLIIWWYWCLCKEWPGQSVWEYRVLLVPVHSVSGYPPRV